MKTISEKQLAANRRNAKHSTGPRTANGKSISRLNSLKHGALARQVVVAGYFHQESADEFKALCREYHQNLDPSGPLEEMLLSQIVTLVWRLRRVRIAESGEIAANVDDHWWNPRQTPWEMGNGNKPDALTGGLTNELETVEGIEHIIECLAELRALVETSQEIPATRLAEYKRYQQEPNPIVCQLTKLRASMLSNPESLPQQEVRGRHIKEVVDYLNEQIADYHGLKAECEQQMDAENSIRRAAAMLPPPEVMEKIVRYESALHRQLYRAINQLERLQRRRLGENVPPPIVMDVSMRG